MTNGLACGPAWRSARPKTIARTLQFLALKNRQESAGSNHIRVYGPGGRKVVGKSDGALSPEESGDEKASRGLIWRTALISARFAASRDHFWSKMTMMSKSFGPQTPGESSGPRAPIDREREKRSRAQKNRPQRSSRKKETRRKGEGGRNAAKRAQREARSGQRRKVGENAAKGAKALDRHPNM